MFYKNTSFFEGTFKRKKVTKKRHLQTYLMDLFLFLFSIQAPGFKGKKIISKPVSAVSLDMTGLRYIMLASLVGKMLLMSYWMQRLIPTFALGLTKAL